MAIIGTQVVNQFQSRCCVRRPQLFERQTSSDSSGCCQPNALKVLPNKSYTRFARRMNNRFKIQTSLWLWDLNFISHLLFFFIVLLSFLSDPFAHKNPKQKMLFKTKLCVYLQTIRCSPENGWTVSEQALVQKSLERVLSATRLLPFHAIPITLSSAH